jgi:ribonuclease P protein component
VYTRHSPVDILERRGLRRRLAAARPLTVRAGLRILAGSFFGLAAPAADQASTGRNGAANEAHISTEQPPSQEDPRLPCAHGDQGRPAGSQPPSRQGPQASRGLTAAAAPPAKPAPRGRFPREFRLTDKPEFDLVHREGLRVSDGLFTVIARPNDLGHARLGLAVGVRAAGNAVRRNRVKRLVRETFRVTQQELPSVDLVVNARPGAGQASTTALRASVLALWDRVRQRCARS